MKAAAGDVRIRVLTAQKREIPEAPDRDRLRLEAADQHPFADDRDGGQRDERSGRVGDAARIKLERAGGRARPLIAGIEDPEAQQRIGRVERELQRAAGII